MNENDSKDAQTANELTVMLPTDHPVVRALDKHEFTWGSYQYDVTAALYMKLCEDEEKRGRAVILNQFNQPIPGVHVGPVVPLEGDVLEGLKESLCVDVVDPEVVGDDTSEIRKTFEGISTVTEVLNFLRGQSWDLWSAVPYIAKFVFPELDTGWACPVHKVGVICWLLKSYGFVANDEPFKEWDT